jgi:hypothetical protein
VEVHERFTYPKVELLSASLQKAAIGDLLHKAVAEAVLGCRPAPLLDDELQPLEL